ncbi:unnamed protein product [Clonostachys rhizophaga]|uniref:YCII-related domain-containing protein n=1 Tax=Clonostachys rhizophaga TaxID=160324 RepID=A0A9N9VB78_9HYPO|nr:unnamed protein product [Clonostachys rhizophaga]
MFFSRVFIAASAAVAVSAQIGSIEYFVYAPAKSDVGVLDRQKAAQAAHLAHADGVYAEGNLDSGGPILTASSVAGNLTFAGSAFLLKVENLEAAKKVVTDDAYYTGDVWDPEKIVVLPYIPYYRASSA